MTKAAQETVGDWLVRLATTNTSTDQDSAKMQNLLRRIGYPNAICTLGIAYMEGKGTTEYPPTSIHSLAGVIIKRVKEQSHA